MLANGTIKVVSVASHDTASAVAAAPLTSTSAYLSSGTWSLVDVEIPEPLTNSKVADANFTNEGGAFGTTRFLKNVMGMWLLERCRDEWKADGIDMSYEDLIDAAFALKGSGGLIFPDDPRFVNPPSMLGAIKAQMAETGQAPDDAPPTIAKVIFDSLAFRYASVLRKSSELTGKQLSQLEILGGGGRNRYLNQMTANATELRVRTGLFEATVVGNALVQAIAAGQFSDLAQARRHVERLTTFSENVPVEVDRDKAERYDEIEGRYM
jgi:rhamnulokinase